MSGAASAEAAVTARLNRSRKPVSLGLSVLLLFTGGPDVYGLHRCPHHPSTDASHHPAHDTADGGHPEAGGAPEYSCSRVVDCHMCLGSSPRPPGSAARIPAPIEQLPADLVDPSLCPLGPRHLLFELHLPNAPPLPF